MRSSTSGRRLIRAGADPTLARLAVIRGRIVDLDRQLEVLRREPTDRRRELEARDDLVALRMHQNSLRRQQEKEKLRSALAGDDEPKPDTAEPDAAKPGAAEPGAAKADAAKADTAPDSAE